MSVNKVILVGNVGNDPEVRVLETGVKVASFPFATSESYKDKKGERQTTTEWHNITIWRGLAEVVEKYVKKGAHLYLEGRIKTDTYEKNGEKRYSTKVVCDQMQMLANKSTPKDNVENDSSADTSADLPF